MNMLQFESIESSPNDEVVALRIFLKICRLAILDDYIVYLTKSDFDFEFLENSITFL